MDITVSVGATENGNTIVDCPVIVTRSNTFSETEESSEARVSNTDLSFRLLKHLDGQHERQNQRRLKMLRRTFAPTVQVALAGSDRNKWKQAIQDKLRSFGESDGWELVDASSDKTIVKCRKFDSEDNIRYRARLVGKGFTQKQGRDHTDSKVKVPYQELIGKSIITYVNLIIVTMRVIGSKLSEFQSQPIYFHPKPILFPPLSYIMNKEQLVAFLPKKTKKISKSPVSSDDERGECDTGFTLMKKRERCVQISKSFQHDQPKARRQDGPVWSSSYQQYDFFHFSTTNDFHKFTNFLDERK
ncbi:hypothetical protein GWI33_005542 [Rhynchophorus ferrugineus]|uniref:Uncharacterized protein n=1 Tax=Rhynchophorus ferrugineus TaxID=354439 RepID=A0A834IKC2_RHYFE|nr:hypothetical protein GWI33_005542 [Rhynchophorus ferrugineus]